MLKETHAFVTAVFDIMYRLVTFVFVMIFPFAPPNPCLPCRLTSKVKVSAKSKQSSAGKR